MISILYRPFNSRVFWTNRTAYAIRFDSRRNCSSDKQRESFDVSRANPQGVSRNRIAYAVTPAYRGRPWEWVPDFCLTFFSFPISANALLVWVVSSLDCDLILCFWFLVSGFSFCTFGYSSRDQQQQCNFASFCICWVQFWVLAWIMKSPFLRIWTELQMNFWVDFKLFLCPLIFCIRLWISHALNFCMNKARLDSGCGIRNWFDKDLSVGLFILALRTCCLDFLFRYAFLLTLLWVYVHAIHCRFRVLVSWTHGSCFSFFSAICMVQLSRSSW